MPIGCQTTNQLMVHGWHTYNWSIIHIFLESQFIYKNSARTVGNALVVSWKLNQLAIKQLNGSSLITSGVYFCPLNKFLEHQNCKEDKIQLCIATIEGKKFTSESISDNEFADYKRNSSLYYRNNFFEKDRHARISGSWNETSDEYECILHGIDECFVSTRTDRDNKEQIMIAVHTGSYAKELLFEVENTGLQLAVLVSNFSIKKI